MFSGKERSSSANNCAATSSKKPDNLAPSPRTSKLKKTAQRGWFSGTTSMGTTLLSDDERYPSSRARCAPHRALSKPWLGCGRWLKPDVQPGFKLNQEGHRAGCSTMTRTANPSRFITRWTGKHDITFTAKKTFYRTPPLVKHLGDKRPYLHNNSVGLASGPPFTWQAAWLLTRMG